MTITDHHAATGDCRHERGHITDSRFYGGSDVGNGARVVAEPRDGGEGGVALLVLPPLGVLWLGHEEGDRR